MITTEPIIVNKKKYGVSYSPKLIVEQKAGIVCPYLFRSIISKIYVTPHGIPALGIHFLYLLRYEPTNRKGDNTKACHTYQYSGI